MNEPARMGDVGVNTMLTALDVVWLGNKSAAPKKKPYCPTVAFEIVTWGENARDNPKQTAARTQFKIIQKISDLNHKDACC